MLEHRRERRLTRLRSVRRLALVLLSLALLMVAAPARADFVDPQWPVDEKGDGCSAPVWPGEESHKDPRRVLVVGDSLIRNSRNFLESKLEKKGWIPTVRCWGAKGTDWGLQQIQRARALKQLPKTIVVSLGTNDIWWLHLDFAQGIDDMMEAIGPKRQVYWVNLWFGPNGYDDLPSPTKANRVLRDKAKQYPNLTIVNFAKEFRRADAANPAVGWEDGVHLNTEGNKVRVRSIAQALGSPVDDSKPKPKPEPEPTPTPEPAPEPDPTPTP